MGLDASVWCNCVETGKLHTPHPFPELLIVDEQGCPDLKTDDEEKLEIYDEWLDASPCEHEQCRLISHHLGATGLIASFRAILSNLSDDVENEYPVLWSQVIYSGSHFGDHLSVEDVQTLREEIINLRAQNPSSVETEEAACWHEFLEQMDELIEASLSINRPIVF